MASEPLPDWSRALDCGGVSLGAHAMAGSATGRVAGTEQADIMHGVRSLLLILVLSSGLILLAASSPSFPSRPPDHDGTIERIEPSRMGGPSLLLRTVRELPRDAKPEEKVRQFVYRIIVHVPPAAVIRGQPADGPRVGQRVRAWCKDGVMSSAPDQQIAEYVEYLPPTR